MSVSSLFMTAIGAVDRKLAAQRKSHADKAALLHTKALGYELGRKMAKERLSRTVSGPSDVVLESKLCSQEDIESDWFLFWCQEIRSAPIYHRKLWEFCYIAQALWQSGKLTSGKSGLAFGCGSEPLPSLFAKYGASVLATDLPADRATADGWRETGQHASAVEGLRRRDICADERKLAAINFRAVDMNHIPRDLSGGFDFCWSACALEHLGSIAKGLRFIENSLRTLRPGGMAVHTTEFSLAPRAHLDYRPTVIYRPEHLRALSTRLERKGYGVSPLNFSRGSGVLDGFVDVPPYDDGQHAHLTADIYSYPCTSFGLIVKKALE